MSVLEIVVAAGLAYTVLAYTLDLYFSVLGIAAIRGQKRKKYSAANYLGQFPSVEVIIPCFNEERTVRTSIRFLREIDYPGLRGIFVNDGSTDHTLQILKDELGLSKSSRSYDPQIPTQTVKDIYVSSCQKFLVVDKTNGGKADSLNTGINLSTAPYICCVDADTNIKRDAMKKMIMPFLVDSRVVAVGGSVRIKNDSSRLKYFPRQLRVPFKLIAALQVIEYIRSINIARNAMSLMNANLIISGAFGLFRTDILRQVGGYEKFSKGEDLELLTRIHFYMLRKKTPYRVKQVYAADSFTNAPENYRELQSQRKRWQVGLVSTLRTHIFKFFRHPLSSITFFSLPYYLLFELISPLVQLLVYLAIPILAVTSVIHPQYFYFLLLSIVYNSLVNICFLFIDFNFNTYYNTGDKLKLISTSLMEPFFYHQLNCYWKLLGTVAAMRQIFVKAAWTPPRGYKEYHSQLGKMSMILNPDTQRGLEMVADYKSLYKDRIVVISLNGSFESSDVAEFERIVKYFIGKKRKRFILDLKELENLSTEALSWLVRLAKRLKKAGGRITVIGPRSKIEDEFRISNVVKEIKIFKNYSDAIKEVKYG